MPEVVSGYRPGTPCWTDLAAPDQQAALDFYSRVFGWSGRIGPPERGGYSICEAGGLPVAGISAAEPPGEGPPPPTVWTTYLSVADAEATVRAVVTAGGQTVMPVTDVMNLGRTAVLADPTGGVFGIWQPRDFAGAGLVNEHGAMIWNELNTTDRPAASAFYRAALGIDSAPMEDGGETYFSLLADGREVGGMQAMPEGVPAGTPSHWLVYFAVEDADRTAATATAAGGSVLKAPFDMVAGRMAVLADSQGAPFAVLTPRPLNEG